MMCVDLQYHMTVTCIAAHCSRDENRESKWRWNSEAEDDQANCLYLIQIEESDIERASHLKAY